MVGGERLITVQPAYDAERTLERTLREVRSDLVGGFVLAGDDSHPIHVNRDDIPLGGAS